jgi:thiol:disulfide interchange protein
MLAARAALAALAGVLACTGGDRPRGAVRPELALADGWSRVSSRAALLEELARMQSRPVVLDFSASWCLPCVELRKSFADPRVRAELADHGTVEIDVSDQDAAQSELIEIFEADALPLVLRFDDAASLHAALSAGRTAAPSLVLRTFVTADELHAALTR